MTSSIGTFRGQCSAALRWSWPGRLLVFVLAATSIWCLLFEMYALCSMRTFFLAILLPATAALYGLAFFDHIRGDRRLAQAIIIGTAAGLAGAVAYDIFRLPFVFSDAWGLGRVGIPQMPLFKVFPRFGAMILGQPLEQGVPAGQPGNAWGKGYSTAAHLLGWLYHFSNGATFGVMFAMLFGGVAVNPEQADSRLDGNSDAHRARVRRPLRARGGIMLRAVAMAVGIEICLLISPYAKFFNIHVTPRFVVVTLMAHVVFGLGLGAWFALHAARHQRRAPLRAESRLA